MATATASESDAAEVSPVNQPSVSAPNSLLKFPSRLDFLQEHEQLIRDLEQANTELRALAELATNTLRELEKLKASISRMKCKKD